jgi:hypothetical protein
VEAIQSTEAASLLLDLGKALHPAALPADEAEAPRAPTASSR